MPQLPLSGLPSLFPCAELAALSGEIAALGELAQAPELAERVHDFQRRIPAFGLSGEVATRLISRLNDQLTASVLALLASRHRLPPTEWCWLAMGSEGRDEQTLVTDQDNGLVFIATSNSEAQALRELFLPFAREANEHLAACGFTLCPGEIMAGNPTWCLSLDEWRGKFIDWVRCPEPEALLNATIFFDLRPLYGHFELGVALRELVSRLTADAPAFLHLMAVNALAVHPPLGFLGDVAVDDAETVDLKKLGSRLFVDTARILALASGVSAVNTFDRLRDAGPLGGMKDYEIRVAQAALSQILRLRLEHQASQSAPGSTGFHPSSLHEIDRVILREALRQARHLQHRLKLNYSL
jgi:CBS domain-containing protein